MSNSDSPIVRVRYWSVNPALQGERFFTRLPIRIGRSPSNHCVLANGFISNLHAAIELVDGHPCVRDVGSRNGVYSREGKRLAVDSPVPLEPLGNAFVLGPQLHVIVEFGARDLGATSHRSRMSGRVLGNAVALEEPPDRWHRVDEASARSELPALPGLSREAPEGRPAPRYLSDDAALQEGSPGPAGQGAIGYGSAACKDATNGELPPGACGTEHFALAMESMALLGLRELAASLMPGVSVQTTGDVARLLTKLHDAIDVFCRSFIAIRDAHDRARPGTGSGSTSARDAVAAAPDPASLALALLDSRNHDYSGCAAVEAVVGEAVEAHRSLLGRVGQGSRELLDDISPARIREAVDARRPPGALGAIGRHRALWQEFEAWFRDCSEPGRAAARVLGPDLAKAYLLHIVQRDTP